METATDLNSSQNELAGRDVDPATARHPATLSSSYLIPVPKRARLKRTGPPVTFSRSPSSPARLNTSARLLRAGTPVLLPPPPPPAPHTTEYTMSVRGSSAKPTARAAETPAETAPRHVLPDFFEWTSARDKI